MRFFVTLSFFSLSLFSQSLFLSTKEIGKKAFVPSSRLKEKVSAISNRPIGTELNEFSGIFDKDFFELSNGFISYGPDVSYMHYRLVFDQKENWVETQELFHSDVLPEDVYYQIFPKMKLAAKKKFEVNDYSSYIKITNSTGFWYELDAVALPKKKKVTLVFDKNLKLRKSLPR
ncbi:MAG: hypothetical protein O9301_09620 [Leptospira sp.]|nr:hypothetical protein [Leptospira sp.]